MSYRADKLGDGRTDWLTDGRTDAGNDNTRRPKLASGNKRMFCGINCTHRVYIGTAAWLKKKGNPKQKDNIKQRQFVKGIILPEYVLCTIGI